MKSTGTGRPGCGVYLCVGVAIIVAVGGCAVTPEWPQWGGPNRDFVVKTHGLADSWPEGGPERLWERELGDGYSSILVDHGTLYTMYGAEGAECVVALDAETGHTVWEHRDPVLFKGTEFGPGPHSTPLIVGNRLFAVGANGVFRCFDKRTGEVQWQQDLAKEYGAPTLHFGKSHSPTAYKNLVILPVDRTRSDEQEGSPEGEGDKSEAEATTVGQSLMAFDQATGQVVWKKQDYPIDYSSPILIEFDGQDQLVLILRKEIIAVDPSNGELLWHHPFSPVPMENITTPLWNGEDLLLFSAAYNSGTRVLELIKKDGKTVPKELWFSRKLRIMHGNAVRVGDYVYGSSGDFGTQLLTCLNIRTGKVVWRQRGFKKGNLVFGDGKLVILDEDGRLALATPTPDGLTVHAECTVTGYQSWTVPTLVGKTLYVRDRKHIKALDLG